MTLDHLRKEIRQEAQRQRREVLKDAEVESARIVGDAETAAAALLETAKNQARVEASQKLSQISAARLEAKKKLAEARDEIVARQLADVREALGAFADSGKYDAVLKELANSGAQELGGSVRVLARKKDLPKLKKAGFNDIGELDTMGGCIVESADGRIRVNHTFEALYEHGVEKLRQAIFEEL